MSNDSFALDLSGLIIHLEYQRKRVLENPYTRERMCFCRQLIMSRYTATLQKFLIRLSARTLKFFDDYNYAITTDMADLREWFYAEIYDILYEDRHVSNKMILLFQTVQKSLDKQFFEIIDERYREIIRKHDANTMDEFSHILEGLYSEVRSWFEVLIYNILAVQLNCENIDDEILTDNAVPNDRICCHPGEGQSKLRDLEVCKNCPFNTCRACETHNKVLDRGENIVIVVTDDVIKCKCYLNDLFDLVLKYHKEPRVVRFTFDFRMYDYANKFLFTQEMKEHFNTSRKLFGDRNISITNYRGVDFNLFLPLCEPFLEEE